MILGICPHARVARGLLEKCCCQLLITLVEIEQTEQKICLLIVGVFLAQPFKLHDRLRPIKQGKETCVLQAQVAVIWVALESIGKQSGGLSYLVLLVQQLG